MLKLFQLKEGFSAAFSLYVITLIISASLIAMLGFLKTESHDSTSESFIVEITPNLDEVIKDNVIKSLKSNAIIDNGSIKVKPAENAFDHFQAKLSEENKLKLLNKLAVMDVILFSTKEFDALRVRDEFMNAIQNIEGVFSMRNIGTFKSNDTTSSMHFKLFPLAVVLCIISLLFSFAVIRTELKRKHGEMKMLSFSGVSDGVILSRIRGSVSFAVLKSWIFAVLLIILAFYLIPEKIVRSVSYIGFKDIIVALSIALVLLLIVLPMYTNQRAKKILNKF